MRVLIAGAGIFGVTAAIELRKRGHAVRLVDPGPIPHPLAASTDISKVVRLEYGPDETYTALAEKAIEGWQRWDRDLGAELYHQTGLLLLRRTPLSPGDFEHDCMQALASRGHHVELLERESIRARFPAWNADQFAHGTFNPQGGFVESGRAVARLVAHAQELGVELRERVSFGRLLEAGDGPGIVSTAGEKMEADQVVAALGAWTPHALPWLAPELSSTGHPVFHLAPADPDAFGPERFPVFCAEIQSTGYYGFPFLRGVVKIGRHGRGRVMHPQSLERAVTEEEVAELRSFLAGAFPGLRDAAIVETRICLYCDSWDGHFWIDRDPDRPALVVAAGDSGHAFKFAPVLGAMVADVVEGRGDPLQGRFRWRPGIRPPRTEEAARSTA